MDRRVEVAYLATTVRTLGVLAALFILMMVFGGFEPGSLTGN